MNSIEWKTENGQLVITYNGRSKQLSNADAVFFFERTRELERFWNEKMEAIAAHFIGETPTIETLRSTDAALITAVREHAKANYEKDGWDIIVEATDDGELAEMIGKASTAKQAINNVRRAIKPAASYRREIESTAF